MKRIISVFLCIVICVSVLPTAAFAVRDTSFEESLATDLKQLGLFKGTGTDFALGREPSRTEALVMLVRFLGKEAEALNGTWEHPFTDVASWADQYVGYAYENKLTNGISATSFGTGNADAAMYLTFVLRALGYSDVNGADFTWKDPFSLALNVGILPESVNTEEFWRADVVQVSYAALSAYMKNSSQTMAQKLIAAGVFTQTAYDSCYDTDAFSNYVAPEEPTGKLTSQQIAEKCSPAVFYVDIYGFNGELVGNGSGFFISSTGLAVTNFHVAANSSALILETPDGKTYSDVKIIDADMENDLALLKVMGSGFPYLEMGNSADLKQGQNVYAIGSPLGLQNTMSQGMISNSNRVLDGVNYLQTTAPIAPGSSGGALIDEYGKVIGVTTAGFAEADADLNLAIPINSVKNLDQSSDGDYALWMDSVYSGFENAYDFGAFSGVELIDWLETPLGYILQYDAFDFHAVADLEASDCYAYTIYYYREALKQNGFVETETVYGSRYSFASETEIVELEIDLAETRSIYVLVEWVPRYYKEVPKLPDLGWYLGIETQDAYAVGESLMYDYRWWDYYYEEDFEVMMEWYFLLLEEQNFVCSYAGEDGFLFEGNGLSVVFMIDGTTVYVDVASQ